MQSAPVLIIDAFAAGRCAHFESLQRWLVNCVPDVKTSTTFEVGCTAGPSPVLVIAHAAPVGAENLAAGLARAWPAARRLIVSHAGDGHTGECVNDGVVAVLQETLAAALGRTRTFQVLPGVIGCCPALCQAAGSVRLMAASDATCLLHGETGTGKELFARAIHYSSARNDQPFVPLNCGAVPDQLFENELFGHVRGAYTDAKGEQAGLLGHAEGGTLFLDEVDCLSVLAQVKLLRVLQEREYRPVGSARSVKADVRIIAATNADLRQRVATHQFREDLFHRLNVLRLPIPPLRERAQDLPLLARWFVREFAHRYRRPVPVIAAGAHAAIAEYRWPGNVRELQALLERAVLLSRTGVIEAADLDLPAPVSRSMEQLSMARAKQRAILQFERSYLSELLARHEGNVSRAARTAGKERRSFQRLLRKHNLHGDTFRPPAPAKAITPIQSGR